MHVTKSWMGKRSMQSVRQTKSLRRGCYVKEWNSFKFHIEANLKKITTVKCWWSTKEYPHLLEKAIKIFLLFLTTSIWSHNFLICFNQNRLQQKWESNCLLLNQNKDIYKCEKRQSSNFYYFGKLIFINKNDLSLHIMGLLFVLN